MSEHWKVQETRCISRSPRDRARCKVKTPAGEYLCEHHKYDLAEMANDPQTCIDIMAERFPKDIIPLAIGRERTIVIVTITLAEQVR